MADHKHGEMDTKVQQSTFDGFIKFTTWSCVAIVGILVFMALFAR
ncbi:MULTISPECIES: aa3-type cytochrome c oxidase subunit IV [Ascidiaceihabitans]|uniref:Cytochrome c oxidase subunit 4 n=1 Tax=Ascidiaceihabitans donghaensis TaxID=1510460 RepID=A0A2R8BAI9_9RHOB|nr:aa3-type cytochrome c oxidase subunit IV [Ascidiaceihabitans donghaensis]SPH20058.1 Cytochrome c oxidase subunit 4 [Ascidiaceihabitans donghaensis]